MTSRRCCHQSKASVNNETTPNVGAGWTRRWTDMRAHPIQLDLWRSLVRFKVVPAGRRSGKTELAKRRLVEHAMMRATWHGLPGLYFAAAPTRDQAKRIYWRDLKAMIPSRWLAGSPSETELCIRTTRGSELWVVGLDKPQRIEGTPWDGGVVDEIADCKPGILDAHIYPALTDRSGWLWLTGVPDMHGPAQAEYERLCDVAMSGSDPEWAFFNWPTADIFPEEAAKARRRMDPKMWEQEYGGRFVRTGGLAFYAFDVARHVRADTIYDPALPICWALDFNVDPMASLVIQHSPDGTVKVIDELTLRDTHTPVAVSAFLDRAAEQGWRLTDLEVYGDAAGHQRRSSASESDWQIVKNSLRSQRDGSFLKVPRANPPIKDTLNAVNARLLDADGVSRLFIAPHCTALIEDLKHAPWPSDLADHHHIAALRYFVHYRYPIRPPASE